MKTIEMNGKEYRIDIRNDPECYPPWWECDAIGDVSGWSNDPKKPGELIVAQSDDGQEKRFYDFSGAVTLIMSYGLTEEKAAQEARAEFERFRSWCAREWNYVTVTVTEIRTDKDGNASDGLSCSRCSVEYSGNEEELREVVERLVERIERYRSKPSPA